MRTAELVVLTCWPPAPDARYVSTRSSSSRTSTSTWQEIYVGVGQNIGQNIGLLEAIENLNRQGDKREEIVVIVVFSPNRPWRGWIGVICFIFFCNL